MPRQKQINPMYFVLENRCVLNGAKNSDTHNPKTLFFRKTRELAQIDLKGTESVSFLKINGTRLNNFKNFQLIA